MPYLTPARLKRLPLVLATGIVAPATAQTLEVAPITVELPAGKMAGTLIVTNRGDRPSTIQVRAFAWSKEEGEDLLTPTDALLVSPPFATLGPGEKQTVRIVLRRPAGVRELPFRLLVDQLPPAAEAGAVRVAVRVSLPVFAAPSGLARPVLDWRLLPGTGPAATLVVRNTGDRRIRISELKLSARGRQASFGAFSFGYALAGSELRIPVTVPPGTSEVHIAAKSDQGKVEADAVLVAPR